MPSTKLADPDGGVDREMDIMDKDSCHGGRCFGFMPDLVVGSDTGFPANV